MGAALLHAPVLGNVLEGDDAWNYVLEGTLGARGTSAFVADDPWLLHQNVHRLLADASWVVRWALFGPWMPGWTLPSLLLQGFNAALVAALAFRLAPSRDGRSPTDVAFAAGAFFAASPLHVHTVSWIGGTYDLVATAGILGAALALVSGRLGWTIVGATVAVLGKESGLLVVPVLVLVWAATRRREGARDALRLLWAPAVLAALVVLLRQLQVARVGVSTDGMAAVRSMAIEPADLLVDAPLAAGAALMEPLRAAFPLDATVAGALGLVLLGAALALRRSAVSVVGTLGALGLAVPPALLREYGHALGLDEVLHNARYVYGAQAFGALALADLVLGGAGRSARGRTVARAVALSGVALFTATAMDRVAVASRPGSAGGQLLQAVTQLETADAASAPRLWLLTNRMREDTYRLALSRWLELYTGYRVQWVQRGSLRVLERIPTKRDGLDWVNAYHQARAATFVPSEVRPGEPVLLLVDRSPGDGHQIVPATLPPVRRAEVPTTVALPLSELREASAGATTRFERLNGRPVLTLEHVPTHPAGTPRGPGALLRVALDRERTVAVRVTYTATLGAAPHALERQFMAGYLEVSVLQDNDVEAGILLAPLVYDGQEHSATLWLDADPVVQAGGAIRGLGFGLDQSARVVLHAVEALEHPRRTPLGTSTAR